MTREQLEQRLNELAPDVMEAQTIDDVIELGVAIDYLIDEGFIEARADENGTPRFYIVADAVDLFAAASVQQ